MSFSDLLSGDRVFLDANTLIYHFAPHPGFGPACTALVRRIETEDVTAFTSTHILGEVAHHLMTFEAAKRFGWTSKVVDKLKHQPELIQHLAEFRGAIERIPLLGINVVTIPEYAIADATHQSQRYGLLTNDALAVAVMESHSLTNIASNDADFDRVPWITRYAPA